MLDMKPNTDAQLTRGPWTGHGVHGVTKTTHQLIAEVAANQSLFWPHDRKIVNAQQNRFENPSKLSKLTIFKKFPGGKEYWPVFGAT